MGAHFCSVFVGLVNNNNKYIQKLNVNRMLYYRIIVGVVGNCQRKAKSIISWNCTGIGIRVKMRSNSDFQSEEMSDPLK